MDLEIWGYIFGGATFGATLFAFIVGLFAFYNGRLTRREIQGSITSLDERVDKRLVSLEEILKGVRETLEGVRETLEGMREVLETNTAILNRLEARD